MRKKAFEYLQKQVDFLLWLALKHHKTHKNKYLDFKKWKYLKQIYCDKSDYIIIKKATQFGITEWLIIKALAAAIQGISVFYVLPTFDLVSRLVKNRLGKTIANTEYYKCLIRLGKEEEGKRADSMKLMDIGKGVIAFIGSGSTTGFTEFPADMIIIDELDECDQANLAMTPERQGASEQKSTIKIANPTIEGFGIDDEIKKTDKKHWYIKCSSCGKWIIPDFFKHVVREESGNYIIKDKLWTPDINRDIYPICHLCGKKYNRFADGEWIAECKSKKSGYNISKMFGGTMKMTELLERFEDGLVNDEKMQRFHNGDLGLAFTSKGAKIDTEMLNDCIEDYGMDFIKPSMSIMGVDVGKILNVIIGEVLPDAKLRIVYIGEVREYEDLLDLHRRYKVKIGVVDALPEERLSRRIVATMKGMWQCFYGGVKKDAVDPKTKTITVSRTLTLDAVKEAVLLKQVILPQNAASIENYYNQMCASTRVYKEIRNEYIWEEGSKADHYFHAEAYMLLARKLMLALTARKR